MNRKHIFAFIVLLLGLSGVVWADGLTFLVPDGGPSGPAGGDLEGNYPNPQIQPGASIFGTNNTWTGQAFFTYPTNAPTYTLFAITVGDGASSKDYDLFIKGGTGSGYGGSLDFYRGSTAIGTLSDSAYLLNDNTNDMAIGAASAFRIYTNGLVSNLLAATFDTSGNVKLPVSLQVGGSGATVAAGETAGAKISASGSAPGAGYAKMEWIAGTNSGTCKLISYAGTSTTPVTIIDNVGASC